MSEQLVPDWVEKKLAQADSQAELDLLRNFYNIWQQLHSIPNDGKRANREQAEQKAQMLVDAAHAINVFRHPIVLNG